MGHLWPTHSKNLEPAPDIMDTYQHLVPFAEQNEAQKRPLKTHNI
jgi:hypothetical protein